MALHPSPRGAGCRCSPLDLAVIGRLGPQLSRHLVQRLCPAGKRLTFRPGKFDPGLAQDILYHCHVFSRKRFCSWHGHVKSSQTCCLRNALVLGITLLPGGIQGYRVKSSARLWWLTSNSRALPTQPMTGCHGEVLALCTIRAPLCSSMSIVPKAGWPSPPIGLYVLQVPAFSPTLHWPLRRASLEGVQLPPWVTVRIVAPQHGPSNCDHSSTVPRSCRASHACLCSDRQVTVMAWP